jgi:hypothetical protein
MYHGIKTKKDLETAVRGYEHHYDEWPEAAIINVAQQDAIGPSADGIPVFVGSAENGTPPPEHTFLVRMESEDA